MCNIESFLKIFDFSGKIELTSSMGGTIFMAWMIWVILGFVMSLFLLRLFVFKIPNKGIILPREIVIGTIIDAGVFVIATFIISLIIQTGIEVFNFTPNVIAFFPYLCISLLTKKWSGYNSNKSRLMSSFFEYILLVLLYWINVLTIIGAVKFTTILPHYYYFVK